MQKEMERISVSQDTIGEEMCYYAGKDARQGTVLRVSRTMNSAMKSAFHILPFMYFWLDYDCNSMASV